MVKMGYELAKILVDEKALEHASQTLGETLETRENLLKQIRQFLSENPQIKARQDDLSLLYFLRSCKFDIDRTKKKIKSYYKMRAERTEWFLERCPLQPEVDKLLEIGVFLPLARRSNHEPRTVVIRTAAHNPKISAENDVLKTSMMILDLLMKQDENISIYGIHAIFDMAGVSLGHALQMTPMIIKHCVQSMESYPVRIRKLEFVNAPIYVNMILDIFRSFMSKKIKERVFVHRGLPTGVDLPSDLGGSTSSYAQLAIVWRKIMQDNIEWFIEDDEYKSVLEVSD